MSNIHMKQIWNIHASFLCIPLNHNLKILYLLYGSMSSLNLISIWKIYISIININGSLNLLSSLVCVLSSRLTQLVSFLLFSVSFFHSFVVPSFVRIVPSFCIIPFIPYRSISLYLFVSFRHLYRSLCESVLTFVICCIFSLPRSMFVYSDSLSSFRSVMLCCDALSSCAMCGWLISIVSSTIWLSVPSLLYCFWLSSQSFIVLILAIFTRHY